MSRATLKHFKQTNGCPECGSAVRERVFGDITTYYCSGYLSGCDWSLDWETRTPEHSMYLKYDRSLKEETEEELQ